MIVMDPYLLFVIVIFSVLHHFHRLPDHCSLLQYSISPIIIAESVFTYPVLSVPIIKSAVSALLPVEALLQHIQLRDPVYQIFRNTYSFH